MFQFRKVQLIPRISCLEKEVAVFQFRKVQLIRANVVKNGNWSDAVSIPQGPINTLIDRETIAVVSEFQFRKVQLIQ